MDVLAKADNLSWEFLADHGDVLGPADIDGFDGLILLAPRVTEHTLEGKGRLRIVARFGVGYDNVDVDACTRAGVLLTITPDGVRRPVACAAMAFILALAHRVIEKDRITRSGRWADRLDYTGMGLVGRRLGIIGLGNIGRELARLARPFDLEVLAFDPFLDASRGTPDDVILVTLDELLAQSDFVCVCCPLTESTRHLIDARRLGQMRQSAYLINVARGPIVDQAALVDALRQGGIAGAALDVFEEEPVRTDDPILTLDHVVVAPHAIAWTDEIFRDNGRAACGSIVDWAAGRVPHHVVNPEVLNHPTVAAALSRERVGS